jgi:hypothetical protein
MKNVIQIFKENARWIITIILLLVIFFTIGAFLSIWGKGWKTKAIRSETNLASALTDLTKARTEISITKTLTEQQVRDFYGPKLDKLQEENIKLKRLIRFTEFELERERKNIKEFWRDSLIYLPGEIRIAGKKIVVQDSCLKITLFSPLGNDSIVFISTKQSIKGTLAVYLGKRQQEFKLFKRRMFRYGEREKTAKMIINCDSSKVQIEDIEILRN